MKRKTVSENGGFALDPKIIGQLVSSAIAWVILRYAGIDLPPEAEAGIAAAVGVLVGFLSPAPKTAVVNTPANNAPGGPGGGV